MNRKLFSRLRQYKLERNSIQVDLADDRKSAIVKSSTSRPCRITKPT
jgi:hypothetical protein